MASKNKNPHWGTTLNKFLAEDGIREATKAEALTRVVASQLCREMERQGPHHPGQSEGADFVAWQEPDLDHAVRGAAAGTRGGRDPGGA